MKLVALSGSIRKSSYNTALLMAMQSRCPGNSSFSIFNELANIPAFNEDLEKQRRPAIVDTLLTAIRDSDAMIISTPEYAHGIPGVLKNALDWAVSSDAIVLKPVLVNSVSTSGLGGVRSHAPLMLVLSAMNANVLVQGSINLPYAKSKFDIDGKLTDKVTEKAIDLAFMVLEQATHDS